MRIVLLGRDGQVGWELQRALAPLGEVIGLAREPDAEHGHRADLLQPDALAATLRELKPDAIVNAAAYTAVDRAETETDLARVINAEAVGVMAREAKALGAWLVHYSTDYVFDGSGQQPWHEDDMPAPLNAYGRTKLEGERAIRASECRHLILRTSWVYSARGSNFAKTMVKLAGERDRLSVIDDQIGAPTGADLIADVTAHALHRLLREPALAGTYHLSAAGETSWHGYAQHVIARARALGHAARVAPEHVEPIASEAFRALAPRPRNSRLDTRRLCTAFGLQLPAWQPGVNRMLREWLERTHA